MFMLYFCLGNEVSGNPGQDDGEVSDGHHGTSQGGPPGHDPSQEAPAEAPARQRPDRTDGKYIDRYTDRTDGKYTVRYTDRTDSKYTDR